MTPEAISTAIVAALTCAEKTGATEVTKKAAGDAYEALKSLVQRKFGSESKPVQALAALEEDPSSEGQKMVLAEQMTKVKAAADPDLAVAAQSLLDLIRSLPSGEQHIQTITGNYNAVADRGGVAKVTIYGPHKPDKPNA